MGSIPGSGRSSGGGNGNPLQYSSLQNAMNRGAWRVTVHGGHTESDMTEVTWHAIIALVALAGPDLYSVGLLCPCDYQEAQLCSHLSCVH